MGIFLAARQRPQLLEYVNCAGHDQDVVIRFNRVVAGGRPIRLRLMNIDHEAFHRVPHVFHIDTHKSPRRHITTGPMSTWASDVKKPRRGNGQKAT